MNKILVIFLFCLFFSGFAFSGMHIYPSDDEIYLGYKNVFKAEVLSISVSSKSPSKGNIFSDLGKSGYESYTKHTGEFQVKVIENYLGSFSGDLKISGGNSSSDLFSFTCNLPKTSEVSVFYVNEGVWKCVDGRRSGISIDSFESYLDNVSFSMKFKRFWRSILGFEGR